MIKFLANAVTISRIVGAFGLLFVEPFSAVFMTLYVYCGITDMIDGTIARKTHTESKLGERLDSISDLTLVVICFLKILSVINIPFWIWVWIGAIAIIKGVNLVSGLYQQKIVFPHTVANRITGFMIFLIPLLLLYVKIEYMASIACVIATFAAIQEGHYIRTHK